MQIGTVVSLGLKEQIGIAIAQGQQVNDKLFVAVAKLNCACAAIKEVFGQCGLNVPSHTSATAVKEFHQFR